MPDQFKQLFNPNLLASHCNGLEISLSSRQRSIVERWSRLAADPRLREETERSTQAQFLVDIFGDLLGYTFPADNLTAHHIKMEMASKEVKGGRTPDARLGFYGDARDFTRAVVELKAPGADLDAKQSGYGKITPVDQAFGYLGKFDDCRWALVSNFTTIRLYSKRRGQAYAHAFRLEDLSDEATLREFLFLLHRDRLIAEPPGHSAVDELLAQTSHAEQKITREFYAFYSDLRLRLFQQIVEANPPPAGVDAAEHEVELLAAAQKILDRVLFICFCEDTGLLPHDIIHTAFKAANTGFVTTTRWEQLCGLFRAVDRGHPPMGIPGYNGGLFRHDPGLEALHVPDDALDDCMRLSKYDFHTDVNVNILGHIFEQSISDLEALRARISGAPVDKRQSKRKQEGVFYTPETVTRYIVMHTVGSWLEERFADLEERHDPEGIPDSHRHKKEVAYIALWEEYQDVLRNIRILDPACGSGAFLVAAFDFLHAEYTRVNQKLTELRGGQPELFDLDKLILQQNLYGVDLNPESVEITKLSLWLKTARTDRPLNDLDGNIKCGNSLVTPHEDVPEELADRAFDWHEEFPDVFADGGFHCVIGNPPYIRQEWLAPYKPGFQREFACYSGTADAYLYFFERGLDVLQDDGRLGYITSGSFNNAKFAAPFRKWLPTVGRFTHVVNFGENQPVEDAEMVYPTISIVRKVTRGSGPREHQHGGSEDRGTIGRQVTRASGPQKRPAGGPEDRGTIGRKDAAPHTFRFYFMHGKVPESIADAVAKDGIDCDDTVFEQSEWRFQPAAVTTLFNRLMNTGRPLGDVVDRRMYYGVKTGLNDAFVIDQATRDRLVKEDPGCETILKKLLRGQDLRPWYYKDAGQWLIFTRRGIDIEQYPSVKAYLEPFRERLEPRPDDWTGRPAAWPGRKPGPYKWHEIQDSVDYYAAFDEPKILWPDIAKLPRFSMDQDGVYVNDKGFIISGADYALLAILQTRIAWFLISQMCTPLRLRGGLWQSQCKKQFVQRLPILEVPEADRGALAELAMQATATVRERYALHEKVRHRILTDLDDGTHKLNQKLTSWWDLDFRTFRAEVKKALKTDLPLKERDAWERALTDWQTTHNTLTARLIETETAINDRTNHLFHLTPAEHQTLQNHMQKTMIHYPLGSV